MGDEIVRRAVISNFPSNRIFLLPQTIFFTQTKDGIKELNKTQRIYNSNLNLTLVAREEESYEIMKNTFYNNKVLLAPDVVFSLNRHNEKTKRRGVGLVLRNDKEGIITSADKKRIKELANSYYDHTAMFDTCLDSGVPKENRERALSENFNKFQSSELIITDRLHGMIFAVITSTPCIAITNYNHKISSSFKWIENHEHIVLLSNLEDLEKEIKYLKNLSVSGYSNERFLLFYDEIFQFILNGSKDHQNIS